MWVPAVDRVWGGFPDPCSRVQIKYRLLCGDPPQFDQDGVELEPQCEVPERWCHHWLSVDMLNSFRAYFTAVSAAFDALLYRAGSKHTLKNNSTRSNTGPLARHNMYVAALPYSQRAHILSSSSSC